ncbi:hypothetical protein C9E85_16230 [Plesiomonas shigelloides]|uniref:hypothetical protein n=1 Tax=Plesiomonas shigelloides TaxID=703 RepID=UPI000D5692AF|nr:hypothetical protein [Plesiomonas shigelloides]PVU64816.1 hypothetical protein C9E85_16230 [Plesiomonas shigelloides]
MLVNLKKNFFNYISLLVGILGIVSSYYFYVQSIKSKEPTYWVEDSVQVFKPDMFGKNQRFSLVDNESGKTLGESVYIQELAFWNRGKDPIVSNDVLTPLNFEYPEDVFIVDVSLSAASRLSVVKPVFEISGSQINLNFNLLEENDGFKLMVVYAAKDKQKPVFSGDILSVSKILALDGVEGQNILTAVVSLAVFVFVIFAGIMILGYVGEFVTWVIKRFSPTIYSVLQTFFEKHGGKVGTAVSLLILGSIAYFLVMGLAEKDVKNGVPDMNRIELSSEQPTNKLFKSDS